MCHVLPASASNGWTRISLLRVPSLQGGQGLQIQVLATFQDHCFPHSPLLPFVPSKQFSLWASGSPLPSPKTHNSALHYKGHLLYPRKSLFCIRISFGDSRSAFARTAHKNLGSLNSSTLSGYSSGQGDTGWPWDLPHLHLRCRTQK